MIPETEICWKHVKKCAGSLENTATETWETVMYPLTETRVCRCVSATESRVSTMFTFTDTWVFVLCKNCINEEFWYFLYWNCGMVKNESKAITSTLFPSVRFDEFFRLFTHWSLHHPHWWWVNLYIETEGLLWLDCLVELVSFFIFFTTDRRSLCFVRFGWYLFCCHGLAVHQMAQFIFTLTDRRSLHLGSCSISFDWTFSCLWKWLPKE